ncbi:hypothetical protein Taro_037992 [Colocasia esculenta]|uniref:Uncharacterized protein n=1 Tax=Colocasia esculenta TaxID=4460 RepID=A0A843WKW4_COLES|nr:hypothetical protein [Colocasia esculenta]
MIGRRRGFLFLSGEFVVFVSRSLEIYSRGSSLGLGASSLTSFKENKGVLEEEELKKKKKKRRRRSAAGGRRRTWGEKPFPLAFFLEERKEGEGGLRTRENTADLWIGYVLRQIHQESALIGQIEP